MIVYGKEQKINQTIESTLLPLLMEEFALPFIFTRPDEYALFMSFAHQ